MSIRLKVEDYCQDCLDFKADVTKPERLYACDEEVGILGDTVIRCECRKRCANIKRYLEQKMKNETGHAT